MGKTFSTGLLTNGIWQDASNNIGIGAAPSGTYKFEVTGTGKFTGDLTVNTLTIGKGGGNLSNNTALGYNVLVGNTTGNYNVGVGTNALSSLGTGSNNTVIGYTAGISIYSGSNNTIVGIYAGSSTLSNNIILADGAGNIKFQYDGSKTIIGQSNNVLIGGTTDSGYKLDVTGTGRFTGALTGTSATFSSSVTANSTISAYYGSITTGNTPATSGTTPVNPMLNLTNNRGIGMYFGGKYSGDYAQWIQVSDVGNLGVNYPLLLNPNGGSVGIGTSSPLSLLHLASSGNTFLTIDAASASNSGLAFYKSGAAAGAIYYLGASDAMRFDTANAERMRITSGGDIQYKGSSTTTNAQAYIENTNTDLTFYASSSGSVAKNMRFFYNGGTGEGMRITSTGNVGIGITPYTNTIGKALDINDGAGMFGYVNQNYVTGNLYFDSAWKTKIAGYGSFVVLGTDVNIYTSSLGTTGGTVTMTERMRIQTSGNMILSRTTYSSIQAVGCYDDTSASSSNLVIFSSGSIVRSTSSLRFKTDIETLDNNISESIYKMRPIWYRSLCEKDKKDWSWYGFGAEELAILEPRLVHWGYKREDYITNEETNETELKEGAELIADGVQYERITVLLVAEMQKQNKAIQEQQAYITSLQDRLTKGGL